MRQALLCFLKYPAPGHVKTRLASALTDAGAAELYRALAERVITELYPLNRQYDLLLFYDPGHDLELYQSWLGDSWAFYPQSGADLGARLEAATRQAFAWGYGKVIVIGSDCIGMDETFMSDAFQSLDTDPFVIGPSSDGGYYLLGLTEPRPWLFENVHWSTDLVLQTTRDRIEAREFKIRFLDEKMDIDTLEDLAEWRDSLPEEHFLSKKVDQIVLERLSPAAGVNDLIPLD